MKSEIVIVSGEGCGTGTKEVYTGKRLVQALRSCLTRERSGGDRWAYVVIDGQEYPYSELTKWCFL